MKLQTLVFEDEQRKRDLYYQSNNNIKVISKEKIEISKDTNLFLGTYFNGFSGTRWLRYTNIKDLWLSFIVKGNCTISVLRKYLKDGMEKTEVVLTKSVSEKNNASYQWKCCDSIKYGLYCIEITTNNSEQAIISNLNYETKSIEPRNIGLTVVICTYKRERFVKRNIEKIKNAFLDNPNADIHNNLELLIIDNGNSLTEEDICSESVFLYPNQNTGGTGGFSRGIIEAIHRKKQEDGRYIILMDDDIELETEVLNRTYTLLGALKEEFYSSFLGGSMLRLDNPCILEEWAGVWKNKIKSIGKGKNLKNINNLLLTDYFEEGNYNAWWFCCIPLNVINNKNLPMPFFIHGDDIEYGLRNCEKIIHLNGIGVWHSVFENKRPSNLEYYDVRNFMIINSIYCQDFFGFKSGISLLKRCIANLMRMRYKDVELNMLGAYDFLKGPENWNQINIIEKHNQIIQLGYQFKYIEGLEKIDRVNSVNKFLSMITLNGAFLPKAKKPKVIFCGDEPYKLFCTQEAFLYEPDSDTAIHVTFSLKKVLELSIKVIFVLSKFIVQYKNVRKLYKEQSSYLKTERYWEQYM
jgi:GT2 family glycosyltransferase